MVKPWKIMPKKSVEAWFGLDETFWPLAQPSPLSTMKCMGGMGTSAAASNNTGRAHETLTPSRTSDVACSVFAGLSRLSVPSWSSSPHLPQLLSESKYERTSASDGTLLLKAASLSGSRRRGPRACVRLIALPASG